MIAESFFDKRIRLCLVNSGNKIAGKAINTFGYKLIGIKAENIVINRCGRGHAFFNAVKTCRKAKCHFKIGVAGGIGAAKLNAGALTSCRRNTNKA